MLHAVSVVVGDVVDDVVVVVVDVPSAGGRPKKVRKAELWFLVKTKVPKVIRHQTPTIDETKRERFHSLFRTVVEGIEREDFAPRPSFSCRFCDFRGRCEAWKGGLPS